MRSPEVTVRNYTPDDYPAIESILKSHGLFAEGQDNKVRLDSFAEALPSAILVCEQAGGQVLGSTYITDSPAPLLARLATDTSLDRDTAFAASKALYDASFAELRRRGHHEAVELYDDSQRNCIPAWAGFTSMQELSGYLRPLWDEYGAAVDDIPLTTSLTVRNYDPDTDYPAFNEHIRFSGHFDPFEDETRLRGFVTRMPSSILVAHTPGTTEIIGSLRVPHSPIPLVSEPLVSPHYPDEEEVQTALYNHSFEVLRERGMPQAEQLRERGDIVDQYGFWREWDLLRLSRLL